MGKELTYKDSGVDIDAANEFVGAIGELVRGTYGPSVIESHGGFAGILDLNGGKVGGELIFRRNYTNPALVACTDGVGTKLKIAFMMGKHDTVGIDLVAMSVNDLIVCGAEPLFFLDYIATGKLEPKTLVEVVRGITVGCREAGCPLLGGETADMPGFYPAGEYDLAGFAVGIVDRDRRIDGSRILPGDVIIGLPSSGIHSNGYSLVRKLFFEQEKMAADQHIGELGTTLGDELLRPTRIYVQSVRHVLACYRRKAVVHGIVHITGGGFWDNIPRVLPKGLTARIALKSWTVPPIFKLIQKLGGVSRREMFRTFNMGIGMMLVVSPFFADSIVAKLKREGEQPVIIGEIDRGEQGVVIA